jgi:hypothetical protein
VSVARAREINARLRAAGITVHEWAGWESRGNGQTSAYEGCIVHHTATAFGFAPAVLVNGRPGLSGPLANYSGNADGSVTVIAAHPANHAGASGGRSMGPLPVTSTFNKRVMGLEIVYPGTQPMTAAQYRTAAIWSRIVVDVLGFGDRNRARAHAETSITGKWDPGEANGRTIDMNAFRAAVAAGPQEADVNLTDNLKPFFWDGRPDYPTLNVGGALATIFNLAHDTIKALHAVITEVTNDPDITQERLAEIVRANSPAVDPVALAAQLLGPLQETLSGLDSVSPEDAEQIAQATARKFAEQLGANTTA